MPRAELPSTLRAEIVEMAKAHNQHRVNKKLEPLQLSKPLSLAATKHAQWMAATGQPDHLGANGSPPQDRIRADNYSPDECLENIYFGAMQKKAPEVLLAW